MNAAVAGVVLSILPGPLCQALNEFAKQTDWQVLFPYKELSDVYTRGVSCNCGPEEALQVLLRETPVKYQRSVDDRTTTATFTVEGTTPTWYVEGGWSYGCQPLSAFSGLVLSRPDQLIVRLGLVDIRGAMLCYPRHVTYDREEMEVIVNEVLVQSRRRSRESPSWGPRW